MSKVRGAQSGELTAISPTLRSHTPCPYLFVWNRDDLISIHPLLFHPSYFRLIRNSSAFTVRITSKSHVQTSRKRRCCKQEILAGHTTQALSSECALSRETLRGRILPTVSSKPRELSEDTETSRSLRCFTQSHVSILSPAVAKTQLKCK